MTYFHLDPPGSITNTHIIIPLNEFINDGVINNKDNIILKQGLSFASDVRIISKDMWEFLYNHYGSDTVVNINLDKNEKVSNLAVEALYKYFPEKVG